MFVTKRYIYTDEGRKDNKIILNKVKLNPFLLNLENPKRFYKDAFFYDYDFSFLGDFFYFDESIANINGKIIEHNLLMPNKRKELFNDLEPLERFFDKYLKKDMVVITFEDLSDFNTDNFILTPFKAFEIENKLNNVYIKNNSKWIDINALNNSFVYAPKFYLKIDKIKEFEGVKGVCKLKVKKDKRFLDIELSTKKISINLLELIKVER